MVYMAEQLEPVRRRVALKVIKLGMDTRSVIARFEAERQALALMEHPNIAQVLDAGTTENGRPYFVMELVRGIKITEYCDENHLSTSERLKLFIQVCQAVQHAHQKGIIHRDLKPSNILVTVNNGVPIPKVIDFGVAKAINQQPLTDKTVFTAFEQFIGTPAYMSPEQAVMTSLDVDTRSDIYSLGVLLYELLTGQTPFDAKDLLKSGLEEMRRTIREKEPVKPSTRLTRELAGADVRRLKLPPAEKPSSEEEIRASSRRLLQTRELIQLLRGDLDWIVMKCLEKDRTRRYETANGLASDIQRHLNHEPVVARPPSAFYRFQKMARRNRVAFTAAAVVAAALIGGLGVSTWLLILETKAHDWALSAEREQARLRERAERAEKDGLEKLREAYLAQARANRRSPLAGRRLDSLKVLQQAAAITIPRDEAGSAATRLRVRNEVIACLALPDLRLIHAVQATHSPEPVFHFDTALERYALVDEAGVVHIRRVATDEELFELPGMTNGESRVHSFSPDGRFLAVGFHLCHLRVWNLERRELALSLDPETSFREVVFAPDSRTVAVVHHLGDGSIPVYELATGRLVRTLKATTPPGSLSFSADGAYLATVPWGGSTVEIIEVTSGEVISRLPHFLPVHVVAWHPDNRLLAVGNQDLHLHLWNPMTGEEYGTLAGHRSVVVGAVFHPSGEFLASTAWDGTTRLWDIATREQLIEFGKSNSQMQFSPDGRRLGMLSWEGSMIICEVTAGRVCRGLAEMREMGAGHTAGYDWADFSPDERLVVAAGHEGVGLWDLATGRSMVLPGIEQGDSAFIHPDGGELFAGSRFGLYRWRLESAANASGTTLLATRARTEPGQARCTAVTRSGALLGYAQNGQVHLERRGKSPLLLNSPARAHVMVFSPDERAIATAPWPDGPTIIWDTSTGGRLCEISTPPVAGLVFSPDSRWLVIATDQEYSFFDASTGQRGRRVPVDGAGPVAFSHDGRLFAIGIRYSVVKLLDVATTEELATLEAPSTPMTGQLAFSPSDTQLAVAGIGQAVQIWDLRTLRRELAARKLDWNHPPFPAGPTNRDGVKLAVRAAVPPRGADVGARLLDLTEHYNAELTETWTPENSLAELAPGVQRLGGVEYDVRGSINLRSRSALSYPHQVRGVRVVQKCERLHFLGGVGFDCSNGTQVATCRVRYTDGQSLEVPVISGRDTSQWWYRPDDNAGALDVVWTGTSPAAAAGGYRVRLCHSAWENPRPEVTIESLDLISTMTDCAPFVVAITAE